MGTLWQDVRYSGRMLVKSPGFTVVAVLTLALGVGANNAMFSLVNSVLLRPLLFPEPDRLVSIVERSEQQTFDSVNLANFMEWRQRQQCFSAMGVARPWAGNLVATTGAEYVNGAIASYDYFSAAGVVPLVGRLFTREDDRAGAERTIVLGEMLWRRLFDGKDAAIGARVTFLGVPHTVIGVLPRGFTHTSFDCSFWIPVGHYVNEYLVQSTRGPQGFLALARLRPGMSLDAARAQMEEVAAQVFAAYPDGNLGRSVVFETLTERMFARVRLALYVLLGATVGILLIACANLANLQLGRARAHLRELAVRAALGASPIQLGRILLLESLLIGVLGCAAGALLGSWLLEGLRGLLPASFPRLGEIALHRQAFVWELIAGLVCPLVFGFVPVGHVLRVDLRGTLANDTRVGDRTGGARWRAALISGQIAITCVLLIGTCLMLRSLYGLYHANLGFRTGGIVTFSWSPNSEPAGRRGVLIDQAFDRLRALPGVTQVGLGEWMPFEGKQRSSVFTVEGDAIPASPDQAPALDFGRIHPDYFQSLRIPLLKGRMFTAQDTADSPRVTIVDTWLAERFFPGQDPIGKRLKLGLPGGPEPWLEIIGVVGHVQNKSPGRSANPQAYLHYRQSSPMFAMSFALRTDTNSAALRPVLEKAMRALTPDIPIHGLATFDERFGASISTERLAGLLLGLFAALALLLAGIGLYGVVNHHVAQRTREMGVRIALGATPRRIHGLVLREGLRLTSIGLILGVAAALVLAQLLRGLLYGVSPLDPFSVGASALMLALTVVLACWLPARRAVSVDPVAALRLE